MTLDRGSGPEPVAVENAGDHVDEILDRLTSDDGD
jgi:hypothetical protein